MKVKSLHPADETLLSSADDAPSRDLALPEPGSTVDRFVVLGRIGAGAAGHVFLAYDPRLSRNVALKLIANTGRGMNGTEEARAMARVTHKNIVTVFDVGHWMQFTFIAMEHVAGGTLVDWLEQHALTSTWQERLLLCLQAADGLAAAHQLGILHRDIKPSNILCDSAQRVLLSDFGMALSPSDKATPSYAGTPAYMSPEQREGRPLDARSDQYSLCVTIYEALYGERPSADTAFDARKNRVPSEIRKLLLRGLSLRPQDRFESVAQLVGKLRDALVSRKRTRLTLAASILCVAAAFYAFFGAEVWCQVQAQSIEKLRSTQIRDELLAVLRQKAASPDQMAMMLSAIDRYVGWWKGASQEVCVAGFHQHGQRARVSQIKTQCLDSRKAEFRGTVEVLTGPFDFSPSSALTAINALTHPSECMRMTAFAQNANSSAPLLFQTAAELDRVSALLEVGQPQVALNVIRDFRLRDDKAAASPLISARAALLEAKGFYALNQMPEAESAFRHAASLAARARQPGLLGEVWLEMSELAAKLDRVAESKVLIAMLGDYFVEVEPSATLAAQLETQHGMVAELDGDFESALAHHRAALQMNEELFGRYSPQVAKSHFAVAHLLQNRADYAAAEQNYLSALDIVRNLYSESHPDVASALSSLATIAAAQGDFARAKELFSQALPVVTQVFPRQHLVVAATLNNLAGVEYMLDDYPAARTHFQESLDINQALLGPQHASVAAIIANVASLDSDEKRVPEAEAGYRRALEIYEKVHGPEHIAIAPILANLAEIREAQDRCAEAIELNTRALAIVDKVNPHHPRRGFVLKALGSCYRKLRHTQRAIASLENAVALFDDTSEEKVDALFLLAQSLWMEGRLQRAIATAAEAEKLAKDLSENEKASAVGAWLKDKSRH